MSQSQAFCELLAKSFLCKMYFFSEIIMRLYALHIFFKNPLSEEKDHIIYVNNIQTQDTLKIIFKVQVFCVI